MRTFAGVSNCGAAAGAALARSMEAAVARRRVRFMSWTEIPD